MARPSMLESPVHGCLTDLLTGVFYAASQPMAVGHSFVIPVVDAAAHGAGDDESGGREEIKTRWAPSKRFECSPPPMRAW